MARITWSHMCVSPLHYPRKGPDLDSFSGKTRDIFRHYFLILCTRFWVYFSSYFQGVTNNFPSETLGNRPKNTNFLSTHQIKNWGYEPLCQNKWLRRWWQNFGVSINFAFFAQKNHQSKYSRTGKIHWCICHFLKGR